MKTKTTSIKKQIAIAVICNLLFFSVGYFLGQRTRMNPERPMSERPDSLGFKDDLQTMIFELRIEHPDIVYAQAQIESANWTSPVWLENNNMFGMKAAGSRITTCVSVHMGYAVYINWRYSVLDYALWQTANARGLTDEQYVDKLCGIYAEDPLYRGKLMGMIKKNK